ncbi:MAG: nickel-responsive transcriptional regulator NikR [Candidatus Asgardarchaeia archaeon]
MRKKVVRISISLPENLLLRFDEILKRRGYSKRSQGIREAMRNFIIENEIMEREGRKVAGAIVILYDHTVKGISDTLIDLQHAFSDIIKATIHIHLRKDKCMELLSVEGNVNKIRTFYNIIASERGVENAKMSIVFTG